MSLVKKKAFQFGMAITVGVVILGYFFYRAHFLDNKDLQSRRYTWEAGKTYVYTIELQQKGWTAFEKAWATQGTAPATPIPYEVKMQELAAQFVVLESNDKATHFALVLPTPSVEFILADKSKQITDSTREGLKTPVYFTLGNRGGISQLLFAKTSNTVSRNLVRTILNEALPQLRAGRLQEPHKADARWVQQTVKEFGPMRIKKSIEGYATERMPSPRKRSQLSGEYQYDLGEGQLRLVSATGVTKAQNYSGESIVQEEHTALSVQYVQEEATEGKQRLNLDQLKLATQPGTLHGLEEFKEAELAILQKRIEGLDFKTKFQEFLDLGSGVRIVDSYRLYEILLAFLKLHPELSGIILQQMDELDGKDSRFDILAMVMLKSDNPELQNKLLDFTKEHWDNPEKVNQVLFNFALDKNLDTQLAERLIQMHDETPHEDPNYSNVVMHLGSVGHEAIDPSIKDAVLERIEKGISTEATLENKRPYVVALGNLGHPNTLEFANPYVGSKQARERQFGAEMLRRVDGPGSEPSKQILLNLAHHDADLSVRRDASKYLDDKQYQGDQLAQLRTMLFQEKDPNVAMNLIDVLGKGEVDRAGAIAILQDYFKQCAHPDVCRKVEGIILGKRN
ncbi:MAG TPA: HEAT repeat domain-containing protein [Oligoflexus sp.]|uniref:HEAT repeat domain-containing protein n=1 Tax=Oligoflexus sp. TaxID=1971216 RepID=UPI002D734BB1|nr:HEAT repeat domain-containing protein [Oligoflexus sp.]HYX35078.1 HEAT repeat domain-containing protein [Oligoflexus sp.]